jgi:hypothetical protein
MHVVKALTADLQLEVRENAIVVLGAWFCTARRQGSNLVTADRASFDRGGMGSDGDRHCRHLGVDWVGRNVVLGRPDNNRCSF